MKVKNHNKDKEWSKKVIERDGQCILCGESREGYLASHHWYKTRRIKATRWEVDNGVALCFQCHRFAHDKPEEFKVRLKEVKGDKWVNDREEQLQKKINDLTKVKNFSII